MYLVLVILPLCLEGIFASWTSGNTRFSRLSIKCTVTHFLHGSFISVLWQKWRNWSQTHLAPCCENHHYSCIIIVFTGSVILCLHLTFCLVLCIQFLCVNQFNFSSPSASWSKPQNTRLQSLFPSPTSLFAWYFQLSSGLFSSHHIKQMWKAIRKYSKMPFAKLIFWGPCV